MNFLQLKSSTVKILKGVAGVLLICTVFLTNNTLCAVSSNPNSAEYLQTRNFVLLETFSSYGVGTPRDIPDERYKDFNKKPDYYIQALKEKYDKNRPQGVNKDLIDKIFREVYVAPTPTIAIKRRH